MDAWKKKIDNWEEDQKHARKAGTAVAHNPRVDKLARLQKMFRCHMCGLLPTGPLTTEVPNDDNGEGSMWRQPDTYLVVNWNMPDNLTQCVKCHKWACEEHIHKGICKKCAEKL